MAKAWFKYNLKCLMCRGNNQCVSYQLEAGRMGPGLARAASDKRIMSPAVSWEAHCCDKTD